MAKLKPWYHALTLREDLRQNRPLDASEFAVSLEAVRTGRKDLHEDYRLPDRFFSRTYLTGSLLDLCSQVMRRLSGHKVETSAIFNMATQFGGGKTHALTALFHLARGGEKAAAWAGVDRILKRADLSQVPTAKTAVIVGTEIDMLTGRGNPGEPRRTTLWGEIAWQLGGAEAFAAVQKHDASGTPPGGDVVRQILPEGPVLILMDELMSFISRGRSTKGATNEAEVERVYSRDAFANQMYHFLHVLSEQARDRGDVVLCVSIPTSELEMTPEDQRDFEALKKLLDRLGKAIMMSEKDELAEIIRRRLFEWTGLPQEADETIKAFSGWSSEHARELAGFEGVNIIELFRTSYPFHPALLSVFQRKWQSLPRFQRTRGVLRLLALWVARAHAEEHKRGSGEPLVMLGSAPLDDHVFRAALFEQLGNEKLEIPVTTDIMGKDDAHALRLDQEDTPAVRKARLHQKVATVIFFESNGGQSQSKAEAQISEIKAGVGAPDLNLLDVDKVLEDLTGRCFYLSADKNRYRFGMTPNLNQVLVIKRQSIREEAVAEHVKSAIQELFKAQKKDRDKDIDRKFFPKKSTDVPNAPALVLVVMGPETIRGDAATDSLMDNLVREYGTTGRTFKSAVIFVVPETLAKALEAARSFLAWQDVDDDIETKKRLDDQGKLQLRQGLSRSEADLRETLFRAYHTVYVLGKDNKLKDIDLGQLTSSQSESLVELIMDRLKQRDEIVDGVPPKRLVQHWPPALREWSTAGARGVFYSSPALPRLRKPESIKRTIADGVTEGLFGYCRKDDAGRVQVERFKQSMNEVEVEIAEDVFLLKAEHVVIVTEPSRLARLTIQPQQVTMQPGAEARFTLAGHDQHGQPFELSEAEFSTTGGTCTIEGLSASYRAGQEPGVFEVEGRAGGLSAKASVVIEARKDDDDDDDEALEERLRWRGTVPSQKWMHFYQKVLSRFATTPGLKIEVGFEVPIEGEAGRAKAEEARVGLRDLGLADNIEIIKIKVK